jgi:hypothetical protein
MTTETTVKKADAPTIETRVEVLESHMRRLLGHPEQAPIDDENTEPADADDATA